MALGQFSLEMSQIHPTSFSVIHSRKASSSCCGTPLAVPVGSRFSFKYRAREAAEIAQWLRGGPGLDSQYPHCGSKASVLCPQFGHCALELCLPS